MDQRQPVVKTIKFRGRAEKPSFEDGTRVLFNFATHRTDCGDGDEEQSCIDDSKKAAKPMELIFGKEFKLPVWEECLKTMSVDEVSEFHVRKDLCANYFAVSTAYRQYAGLSKPQTHHCCGSMMNEETGCPKLDKFLKKPCDLRFTFELLKAEEPGSYDKESWIMTPEERIQQVPLLKEEGNELYRKGKVQEASKKYFDALSHLEALCLREKPGGDEYRSLEDQKWPILLNYAQCKLTTEEFYEVIRYCDQILEKQPNNIKALFRRGRAHLGAWNPREARADFEKVIRLDPSLRDTSGRFLKEIDLKEKQQNDKDKQLLQNMFTK